MIIYAPFLLFVFELKPNIIYKHLTNNIINKVIDVFCLKTKLNNTPMNLGFENNEFEHTDLTLKVSINIFLTEFDKNKITVHIFFD